MIRYVESGDINREKWDDCIRLSASPAIFVYSWFLDTVSVNWAALVLNDYEAVFPFAYNKKYGISYIYQPFFTRYFGVYSKNGMPSANLLMQFLNKIPSSFSYINLCLNSSQIVGFKHYFIKQRRYQVMDLIGSYEELKKRYSDNTRRNIKKAVKADLKIVKEISPLQIVTIFRKTKGDELNAFGEADYNRLSSLMHNCLKNNCGETIAVYDRDELCAAAFFMHSDNRFVFLKSGVTEQGRMNGAMHFLVDNFINQYSNSNKTLDFGGSSVESVARFYKSFGAQDYVYLQLENKRISKLIRWIKSFKF
ncbi:MAG TPA: hypothetical protein VFM99_07555 [Chitinophagales bacterium]|nr:hypothetical protein [Chitinophagales bacterium]